MSNSNQISKAKSDDKSQHKLEASAQFEEQAEFPLQNKYLDTLSLNNDFEGQVDLLANPSLTVLQRQEIAQKIAQTQGNSHLQKLISSTATQKGSEASNPIQRYQPTRPRLSDPEVVSAIALGTFVRLTFNMTWTRDEVVSFLWPNGPIPPVNFFMPDPADPWKTDQGECQRFLILPNSFTLQGIRQNVHRMIYESIPEFSAESELPNWVPDEVKAQIQEAFAVEGDFRLYGQWPNQDDQYAQGLYWMRRRGRRTHIEVAQLPDPSDVRDQQSREARITVNQYITSYVVSEGMSISEAKAQTRERTRQELIIAILEAIAIVIPARIPRVAIPRARTGAATSRARRPTRRSRGASAAAGEAGEGVTRRRLFAQRNPTIADPSLPPGSGSTDRFGNMTISSAGSATDQALARYHEQVHSFLSPRLNFLRNFRANLGMSAYNRSALLRYLEEALAETYAQLRVHGIRNLPTGIRFPIREGYVTLRAVVTEAAIGTVLFGGVEYGVYIWASEE